MSRFFQNPEASASAFAGREQAASSSEPIEDEATADLSSPPSSDSPSEKSTTFLVLWQGTIDELFGDAARTTTNLVFSKDAIGGEFGILSGGCIKVTNSSFPMGLLISSKQFKNSVVVSRPGITQRGMVIAHPGHHCHSKEYAVLTPHTKSVDPNISKHFKKFATSSVDEGVSYINDDDGKPHAVQINGDNPLKTIIVANQINPDGTLAYRIDEHTHPKKRALGGICVSHDIYVSARTCFLNKVAPHLVKQNFSEIEFTIQRAGANWGDDLSPAFTAPLYRTTTYELTMEVELCYQLLPSK